MNGVLPSKREVSAMSAFRSTVCVVATLILIPDPTVRAADLEPADWQQPTSEMLWPIARFDTDQGSLNRFYSYRISPARLARMRQFHTDWLAALEKLDFDGMGLDGRIDYLLLKNHLNRELHDIGVQEQRLAEQAPLLPFAKTIQELEDARRRMESVDSPKAATVLTKLVKQMEDTRRAVDLGLKSDCQETGLRASRTVANRAAGSVDRLRDTLRRWHGFYNDYDPVFTWWLAEPYKEADKALQDYAKFLREKVVGLKADDKETIVGDPIGREALLLDLKHEMVPYTPEELVAIANKEFAWCEAEMKRASNDLGFGDEWKKALEFVKNKHVEPGKQPELIRDLALEAIRFLDQHDLVTIPPLCRDSWRMEMMSPERQLVNPFFTGGEVISVSFPTSTMTHEQKQMSLRGNNIHFSRATVHHELIPGHHLQLFMAERYRPYRSAFQTPFLVEGWALYWEMLLWDMKFPKSPEDRVGMLFWRMHRCARIIFSLGFHLGTMTPQQCIDLLVDRVGHERENAAGEVRRSFQGGYSPLYQCAYMLGALQLRALRREVVDTGKMTDRAFHDAVLKENAIPIELIRAKLTNRPPRRDFVAEWKFYGTELDSE
jgi:uncharacterized protein (DUF885 family)